MLHSQESELVIILVMMSHTIHRSISCNQDTHPDEGPLEGGGVIVHVVTAKTEETHETQHEVSVHEPAWVTGQEILQCIGLLLHWDRNDTFRELIITVFEARVIC